MTPLRRRLLAGCIALTLISASSLAIADASARQREQLAALRASLVTHAEQDDAKLASDDIQLVSSWLDQADELLAKREGDQASYRLKRAEYGVELVGAIVIASQIEAKANDQEAAFVRSDEQIAALKQEVEQLQQKRAALNSELNTLR